MSRQQSRRRQTRRTSSLISSRFAGEARDPPPVPSAFSISLSTSSTARFEGAPPPPDRKSNRPADTGWHTRRRGGCLVNASALHDCRTARLPDRLCACTTLMTAAFGFTALAIYYMILPDLQDSGKLAAVLCSQTLQGPDEPGKKTCSLASNPTCYQQPWAVSYRSKYMPKCATTSHNPLSGQVHAR